MNDDDANDDEHEMVLRADQSAFIVHADGSCEFRLPVAKNGIRQAEMHRLVQAIAVRLDDPDWIAEMLEAAKSPPACVVIH